MSASIGADNNTLAGIYDLNKNSAEIAVIKYTLPVTWGIMVKANKVCQAISFAFIVEEHRRIEVLVIQIVVLLAQFVVLCGVQLKSTDQIARLVVGSDLHGGHRISSELPPYSNRTRRKAQDPDP